MLSSIRKKMNCFQLLFPKPSSLLSVLSLQTLLSLCLLGFLTASYSRPLDSLYRAAQGRRQKMAARLNVSFAMKNYTTVRMTAHVYAKMDLRCVL
jgi:hypothetical protein